MIKVTVWNEYVHEVESEVIRAVYPDGIHGCIKEFLQTEDDLQVRVATLNMPECGLTDEVLEDTDVLLWWGHKKHGEVPDEIVKRVQDRVLRGMGLIVLHSGHHSKIFRSLMGTTCDLRWRDNDRERVWCANPAHPIAQGIPAHFELEHEEMYGEHFTIPNPDDVVFIGWFAGGEVFRSGCTFARGLGKIFYFQPGHEEYPIYRNEYVQKIIKNAIRWAKPTFISEDLICIHAKQPLEK
ncbi:MAG: ThuA domain-containing protein [Eubacteriales bacterium]|nr:ThuA domain-containing protein [Eubacteriales bacterium]